MKVINAKKVRRGMVINTTIVKTTILFCFLNEHQEINCF